MIDIKVANDEKLIRILCKDLKTAKGVPFKAFSAVQKDKRLIDCKFTTLCNQKPTCDCYIHVKIADINIDRNRLYPVLWVRNVIKIYIDDGEDAAKDAASAAEVDEAF